MNHLTAIECSVLVLSFFDFKGDTVTNKKLQKLLYFINAWHLAYFEEPLIEEEPKAWRFGPVFTTSYHKYKQFGYNNIDISEMYGDFDNDPEKFLKNLIDSKEIDSNQFSLVRTVLLKYGSFSAYELELISHNDPPWIKSRNGLNEFQNCDVPISHQSVLEVYKQRIAKK